MTDIQCPSPLSSTGTPVFTNGYIAYNGVVLNLSTKTKASVTPVYSDSGRQIKYLRHVINVDAILVADECNPSYSPGDIPQWSTRRYHVSTTGSNMADYRALLTQPGKELQIQCIGLGYDLWIADAVAPMPENASVFSPNHMILSSGSMDAPNTKRRVDVLYGPRPQLLDWEPIGHSKACRINWVVEFHVARCYDERTDIPAFEWSQTWSIGEAGLTARTTTGTLEVTNQLIEPTSAASTGTKPANDADRFRPLFDNRFPRLEGFHRTSTYSLSEDRRILTFNITDAEIDSGDNPYFPGVVRASVNRNTSNTRRVIAPGQLQKWNVTLTGQIEVKPELTKKVAWAAFITIVREQMSYFKGESEVLEGIGDALNDRPQKKAKKASFAWISRLSINEPIFGRTVSFTIGFTVTTTIESLLAAVGHFEPLDSLAKEPLKGATEPEKIHDWERWGESMRQPQSSTGNRGLVFDRQHDAIVSICDAGFFQKVEPKKGGIEDYKSEPVIGQQEVDAERSYADFRNAITVYENTRTVRQDVLKKPSTEPKETPASARGDFRKSDGAIEFSTGPYQGAANEPSVITHRRGESIFDVILSGYGIRVGRACPVPKLESWRNTPVKIVDRTVSVTPIGRGTIEHYLTQWRVWYTLENAFQGDLSRAGSTDAQHPQLIGHGLAEGIV